MGSKVTVYVELDRHKNTARVSKELPIWIVEEAFRVLDHPSRNADPFSKMLCSPAATIEATIKSRHVIAKELANEITNALIEAMGAGDTEMGYQKK